MLNFLAKYAFQPIYTWIYASLCFYSCLLDLLQLPNHLLVLLTRAFTVIHSNFVIGWLNRDIGILLLGIIVQRARLNRQNVYSTAIKHLIPKIMAVCFLQVLKLWERSVFISVIRGNRAEIAIMLHGIKPLYRRARLNRSNFYSTAIKHLIPVSVLIVS